MRIFLFIAVFICILFKVDAQNVKGFYVNGFNAILGNVVKEDSLLLFAKNNNFNYLTLYDVHLVHNNSALTNTVTAQSFANFINKAKTQYSISEIGVAAENYNFFANVIHVYNQQHPSLNQKVDVYNLEFEFWIPASVASGAYYCTTYLQPGGFTCDTAGGFAFFKKTLKRIDSLANANGQKSEAYFGFFNTGQGKQIVQTGVDRVLLSIYITSLNYSQNYQYNYVKPRLQNLATANSNIKVMTLYSSEPSFMQTWVGNNPFFLPYTNFESSLIAETGTWKSVIQPEGIQWFTYSHMPKKNMTTMVNENIKTTDNTLVYPNPAHTNFIIEFNETDPNSTFVIANCFGQNLLSGNIISNSLSIDVTSLSNGIYILSIMHNGKCSNHKIVIE